MRSISDLATKLRAGEGTKLASTAEFLTRADGLRPLQRAYGFEFMSGNVVAMEPGTVYSAVFAGAISTSAWSFPRTGAYQPPT